MSIQLTIKKDWGEIVITGQSESEIVKKSEFFMSLPSECPECGLALKFQYRNPKDNDYFEMKCIGHPTSHRTTFGQFKANDGTLYYKAQNRWDEWVADRNAGQDRNGGNSGRHWSDDHETGATSLGSSSGSRTDDFNPNEFAQDATMNSSLVDLDGMTQGEIRLLAINSAVQVKVNIAETVKSMFGDDAVLGDLDKTQLTEIVRYYQSEFETA